MKSGDALPEMESEAPLVSFVTPFYNTAAYLEECITSVLRQTYRNWEYVLVNNCSTDSSAEIADRYAKQYPGRIRLQHNTAFLSQVQDYNAALRAVSPESKYCKVVQRMTGCFQIVSRVWWKSLKHTRTLVLSLHTNSKVMRSG